MELLFTVGLVIGILTGSVVTSIISKPKVAGTLRVDTSDPEDGPYMFLELTTDIQEVYKADKLTFKVKIEDYVPHK